jgi:Zn-dependent protease
VVAAGTFTSFVLAGVFYVTRVAADPYPQIAAAALYMTYVNLILACFNMIPGFPLDGGRLLRALLWKLMNHYGRATQWAAIIGLIFAISLILAGSLAFFASQFFITSGSW